MMARALAVAVLVFAAATAGCGMSSPYMTRLEGPVAIAADPGTATVVFIRPSGYAGGIKRIILDGQGRFLGECWGQTYFAVRMPPGEHLFIAWSEGTPALKALLEPGKIYYVEVSMTMGAWQARSRLFALGPQREGWPDLPRWLATSTMLIPNEAAGQVYLQERAREVAEVVQKGFASYGQYVKEAQEGKPEALQKRTLLMTDGVVPEYPR